MGLSSWEQDALDSIKDRLASSDPTLVARLNIFARLASGEEMPAREKIRAGLASCPALSPRRYPPGLVAGRAAAVAGDDLCADRGRADRQPRQPGYVHGHLGHALHRYDIGQFGSRSSLNGATVFSRQEVATAMTATRAMSMYAR